MGALSLILRSVECGKVAFHCPGCDMAHAIPVAPLHDPAVAWGWNGDVDKPTFTPSILVTTGARVDPSYVPDPDFPDPPECCHSFVTDGRIAFLSDCTHVLAGQTVDIPAWPT